MRLSNFIKTRKFEDVTASSRFQAIEDFCRIREERTVFTLHFNTEETEMVISNQKRISFSRARITLIMFFLSLCVILAGCGSAYSGLTRSQGLGAGQYMPAVVVEPGNEGLYQQTLTTCRSVAENRQATAAQEAQLRTLTGTVGATGTGAATGAQVGNLLGDAGYDTGLGEGAAVGAGVGFVSGLVGAFASGAETTAAETKKVLLNCLRVTSANGTRWHVVE